MHSSAAGFIIARAARDAGLEYSGLIYAISGYQHPER